MLTELLTFKCTDKDEAKYLFTELLQSFATRGVTPWWT